MEGRIPSCRLSSPQVLKRAYASGRQTRRPHVPALRSGRRCQGRAERANAICGGLARSAQFRSVVPGLACAFEARRRGLTASDHAFRLLVEPPITLCVGRPESWQAIPVNRTLPRPKFL